MSDWLETDGLEFSALVWGDPATEERLGGIVVFGSPEEVRRAAEEGPFDAAGYVEFAAPMHRVGALVQVGCIRVVRGGVVDVEPFDFEAALEDEEPGGWCFG